MLKIIQSNQVDRLVDHLILAYQAPTASLFERFLVVVPSVVLGDWLQKTIATEVGISTLVTTTFWGQYQWDLMKAVLSRYNQALQDPAFRPPFTHERPMTVPEVAVLSPTVMQWRLFGYFTRYEEQILQDKTHPLFALLWAVHYRNQVSNSQSQSSTQTDPSLNASLDQGDLPDSLFDKDLFRQAGKHSADQTFTPSAMNEDAKAQKDRRLWQLAGDLAQMFGRYLTYREDWLDLWTKNQPVDVADLIAQKDAFNAKFNEFALPTPDWLEQHYIALEAAQRYLWQHLFAEVHQYRQRLEARFWAILTHAKQGDLPFALDQILPKRLFLFTIQQMPQSELDFLQRLSYFIDIHLLHYNPSQLFWADIVDKRWLQQQEIINPSSVFLKDYGHTLLSRLGKQSRETFAMLANLSGNESMQDWQVDWQDDFIEIVAQDDNDNQSKHRKYTAPSLLQQVQQDILMLDESQSKKSIQQQVVQGLQSALTQDHSQDQDNNWYDDEVLKQKSIKANRSWQVTVYDDSLAIHTCHTLKRQLEVLRLYIGRWLNQKSPNGQVRHLSDIAVILPDIDKHQDMIEAIFGNEMGQDRLILPAKVTGVTDRSTQQLWQAIVGFFRLIAQDSARFSAQAVFAWLSLPPLYESLGLTHDQMSRACDLLQRAGFIRGFDENHLQKTLYAQDQDYRHTFSHALDRLVLGLLTPNVAVNDFLYQVDDSKSSAYPEKTVPFTQIRLEDTPIVEALSRLHEGINACRDLHHQAHSVEFWLGKVIEPLIHQFFAPLYQTASMRAIFTAMNNFKSSLRANQYYQYYHNADQPHFENMTKTSDLAIKQHLENLPLKLDFMLSSIETALEKQQVSSEPAGVITFGRFGALRNIPFKLIVMINMNLDDFAHKERNNLADLMKAGLPRRGDRFTEDDNTGAFLDALLCAKENCWIFYNGQSLNDSHEHLPASPVSELLQFLQGEIKWQWQTLDTLMAQNQTDDSTSLAQSQLVEQIHAYLPKLIETWLITHHSATPFAKEEFITQNPDTAPTTTQNWQSLLKNAMHTAKLAQKSQHPPAPLWQNVFYQLNHPHILAKQINMPLLSDPEYHLIADWLRLIAESGHTDLAQIQQTFFSDTHNHNANPTNLTDSKMPKTHHAKRQLCQRLQSEPDSLLYDPSQSLSLQYMAKQLENPAQTLLKTQGIHLVKPIESKAQQEPLILNPLEAHQLNKQILQNLLTSPTDPKSNNPTENLLFFTADLPAGIARQTTLDRTQTQIQQQIDQLLSLKPITAHHAITINPQQEAQIALSQITIKSLIPLDVQTQTPNTPYWLNFYPHTASAKHLLSFWLHHLFWQIHRKTTCEQVSKQDGQSIWQFNKNTKALFGNFTKFKGNAPDLAIWHLAPIEYRRAQAYLLMWLQIYQIMSKIPLIFPIDHALTHAITQKIASHNPDQDTDHDNTTTSLDNEIATDWLDIKGYGKNFGNKITDESWQFIFLSAQENKGSTQALTQNYYLTALQSALNALSTPLLDPLIQNLHPFNPNTNKNST